MESQVLRNLEVQVDSVRKRIGEAGRIDASGNLAGVLRSLRMTIACIRRGSDPRVEAILNGSAVTVSKVPDTDPVVRRGDRALPVSGRYVAHLFEEAGAKLHDYQVVLLDPELAAGVIDVARGELLSREEMLRRDMRLLGIVRRRFRPDAA